MSIIRDSSSPHKSPCVGVCSATALGDKYCIGCKRHERWVRNWNTYPVERKIRINQYLNPIERYIMETPLNSDPYVDIPLEKFSPELLTSVIAKYEIKYNRKPLLMFIPGKKFNAFKSRNLMPYTLYDDINIVHTGNIGIMFGVPMFTDSGIKNESDDDFIKVVYDNTLANEHKQRCAA